MFRKKDLYNYTNRIYRFLEKHGDAIIFIKIQGPQTGFYDRAGDEFSIEIDYRKEIIPTLIHELLHRWYPEWCETKVRKVETQIVNQLSERQCKNILKKLANAL